MPIPQTILTRITFYARQLTHFNAGVDQCRTTGTLVHSPGRYEWEYRLAHEHEADAALAALADVEALAAAHGVSLDELYAHVGGQPVVTPWSPEAAQWRRPHNP